MKIDCFLINKILKEYVKDNLYGFQSDLVASHLRNCPKCMDRYYKLTKVIKALKNRKEKEKIFEKISAQIDFEKLKNKDIDDNDILITLNKNYEEEYKKALLFVNIIEKSVQRKKKNTKIDVVQNVMNRIY